MPRMVGNHAAVAEIVEEHDGRNHEALRLARAFWPGRWSRATLGAASAMLGGVDPLELPEYLDNIEAAIESTFDASGTFHTLRAKIIR